MSSTSTTDNTNMMTVRALLDQVMIELPQILDPAMPVREAERDVAAALKHSYQALACRGDFQVFRAESAAALERTRDALAVLRAFALDEETVVAQCARGVAQALSALRRVVYTTFEQQPELPRAGERKPLLRATVGVPTLLDVERGVVDPTVPLPELGEPELTVEEPPPGPPPIATLAELEARMAATEAAVEAFQAAQEKPRKKLKEVPPKPPPVTDEMAEREHFGVQIDREKLLLDRARSCMEDLASLGRARRPTPLEPWYAPKTEARLLTKVDAIVACGDWVLPHMVKLLEGRPLPDPELTWANVFLFGSLHGDDALDEVKRLVECTPLGMPEMRNAVVDALALAPHPGIDAAIRPWLSHGDPTRRSIAVRVLARRRSIVAEEAVAAVRDKHPLVVLAGARALGFAQGEVAPGVLHRLLYMEDPKLVKAALRSSILRRSELGVRRGRELLTEGRGHFANAALFVAIGSGVDALQLLREDAAIGGSAVLMEALGWFGSIELVDYLIGRVGGEDKSVALGALGALQRITGASLTDDLPDPDYGKGDEPFLRGFRPHVREPDFSKKAEVWEAWWKKHQKHAKATVRYRHGHAWSVEDDSWELEDELSGPDDRRMCFLELVARTGGTLPFEPSSFIVRQRQQIGEWRSFLGARRNLCKVGSWTTRYAH